MMSLLNGGNCAKTTWPHNVADKINELLKSGKKYIKFTVNIKRVKLVNVKICLSILLSTIFFSTKVRNIAFKSQTLKN